MVPVLSTDFSLGLTKEESWLYIDQLAEAMIQMGGRGKSLLPTVNTATEGLWSRRVYMPAGTCLITDIHAVRHQYAILTGEALVWTFETNWVKVSAPDVGITEPGTRRLFKVLQDMIFITFHPMPDAMEISEEEFLRRVTVDRGLPDPDKLIKEGC